MGHPIEAAETMNPSTCGCYPPDVLNAFQTITDFNKQLPQTICTVESMRLEDTISRGTGSKGAASLNDSLSRSRVILAGDVHLYTDESIRLSLIRQFKKVNGNGSCVALEWPSRSDGWEGTLKLLKEMEAADLKVGGKNVVRAENVRRMIKYYEPMGKLAKDLGLTTVTVDHSERMEKDLSMDDRNYAIAANISKLLESKSCKAVLMFVGKSHIARSSDSTTSLPKLVREKGLSVTSINIQMTNETSVPTEAKSFTDCKSPKLEAFSFFANSELAGDPNLFPNLPSVTVKWKDFDSTLLAP